MTIKHLTTALAVMAGLLLSAPTAQAGRPLNVDCDVLAATNDAVNTFLDEAGVEFNSVGDLFSSAIVDDGVFEMLRDLILAFSVGEIEFQSASQAISTNAKCGLLPGLIDQVND